MKNLSRTEIDQHLIALTTQFLAESGEPYHREIKINASLQRHLGVDSLGRAELFRRIEQHFDVTIPDSFLVETETLNDIAVFLQSASPRITRSVMREVVKSHGERPHVNIASVQSLTDVVMLYGQQAPNNTHIYFQHEDGTEEIITYEILLNNSLRIAKGLRQLGLKEGETVAIMQPTTPGFFYIFLGTLLAGGIPVPIYPPFRMHMIEAYAKTEAKILTNAEVRILVTFEQAENLSRILQAFVPSLKHVTTVNELLQPELLQTPYKAKPENYAFVQYTSGSTADPKGVLLSHFNLISNIRAYGKGIKATRDDVAVSWLPLYHDLGLIGMWLGSLYHGIPLVLMTPFSFLNKPERWLWAIHHHRGTVSGAPNFAYDLCIRKIEPHMIEGLDLSSWRLAANGAEKVYARTLEQFAEKFAPYGFNRKALYPVYGLAESTVGLILPEVGEGFHVDYVNRKLFEEEKIAEKSTSSDALAFVACGKPIEEHEVRIVDDNDHVLPERHVGVLQFRGPSSMQGYFNNPRATQAVFHKGWIDSGDLAYKADGQYYITGRRKDVIVKAGRNLYPAEIEECVGKVAGVRQGSVIAFGVNDEKTGTEQLIVVAETKERSNAKRAQLAEQIKAALSAAIDAVPDQVVMVAPRTVPKTSSGKLQRAACKNMYLQGKLNRFHTPAWMQVTKLGLQWLARKIWDGIITVSKLIYTCYVALITVISLLPVYFIVRFASYQFAARAVQCWARWLLHFAFCPVTIIGRENLTKTSPIIFAANHASYIDALVAVAYSPVNTRFVAKKELFTMPIIRTIMKKLKFLPVDRQDLPKGIEDTHQIETALKMGSDIFMFPEGTFGYASGLRPFRLGAFKIAAEAKMPVCPVALRGTRTILRGDEKMMRPGKITMTVCPPIKSSSAEWQDITQLRNEVRAEIAKYCGEPSLDLIAAQTVAPKPSEHP